MRVTIDSEADGDGRLAVRAGGAEVGALWSRRLDWTCRDTRLAVRIIAAGPVEAPAPEPSEPVPGALARLQLALRGSGGLLALLDPAEALGRERIAFAEGVRLFAVAGEDDEACWDAALSLGQPVYGLCGRLACDLAGGARLAEEALSALTYGLFTCEQGLALERLDEDAHGVRWRVEGGIAADTAVVVRGGYEAAVIHGAEGEWRDGGGEGYVRLVVRGAGGARCLTQPRFVAPRREAARPEPAHG